MAGNRMKYVDKMMSDYRKGMPDGLSTEYFKQIPVLFARIQELERALDVFARTGARERQFGKELVEVYLKDCMIALEMMDPNNATNFPPKEIYYPA